MRGYYQHVLKTLTGAITPVMIGSALAYMDGHFQWLPALICCLFASLMQIAANFINDLFDYLKGTDREDRLGPERALCTRLDFTESHAKRNHHHRTICLSDRLFAVVLCRMGANHSRTSLRAIRFPLYHRALSIVLQRLGRYSGHRLFGFVPVGGTYYVQALTWTTDTTIASLICGLLIDTLLVVNNYRDREADARSGKRTVIVRFGEKFGSYLYLMLGMTASLLCFWFLFEGHLYAALLPLLYLIPHFLTWKRMVRIHSGKN